VPELPVEPRQFLFLAFFAHLRSDFRSVCSSVSVEPYSSCPRVYGQFLTLRSCTFLRIWFLQVSDLNYSVESLKTQLELPAEFRRSACYFGQFPLP